MLREDTVPYSILSPFKIRSALCISSVLTCSWTWALTCWFNCWGSLCLSCKGDDWSDCFFNQKQVVNGGSTRCVNYWNSWQWVGHWGAGSGYSHREVRWDLSSSVLCIIFRKAMITWNASTGWMLQVNTRSHTYATFLQPVLGATATSPLHPFPHGTVLPSISPLEF